MSSVPTVTRRTALPGVFRIGCVSFLNAKPLIDGLEGKGLVERTRSREDRRLQLVSITADGERVVDAVDHMGEALGTGLRQGISREERTQLVSILQRIRQNLRAMEKRDAG